MWSKVVRPGALAAASTVYVWCSKSDDTDHLLRTLWGSSTGDWESDRDGYFLQMPPDEVRRINQASRGELVPKSFSKSELEVNVEQQPNEQPVELEAELFGEITTGGVRQLFGWMRSRGRLPEEYVFCDLGSGTGKMTCQVALEFGPLRSIGVELSCTRHDAGIAALAEGLAKGLLTREQIDTIELQNANILDIHCHAHLVYLANYAFSDSFTQHIGTKVLAPSPELIYVVTIRPFEAPKECGLALVAVLECEMSWTTSQRLHIYERKIPRVHHS